MNIAFQCVMIAGVLPYLINGISKFGLKGFDPHAPRTSMEQQVGWRKRAHWAHLNAFETFPFFAAAVVIAHLQAARTDLVTVVSVAFVVLRVLHAVFYIADWAHMRTLAWVSSLGCVFGLFLISL